MSKAAKKESAPVYKVSPYPFPVTIKREGKEEIEGKVRLLTPQGFLMETNYEFFRVGATFDVSFEIPVYKFWIESKVRVMKTLQPIEHARRGDFGTYVKVELHFVNLSAHNLKIVKDYLIRIGQNA